jgi:hypothetical protein
VPISVTTESSVGVARVVIAAAGAALGKILNECEEPSCRATLTVAQPGRYTITVEAVDREGRTGQASVTIQVTAAPAAPPESTPARSPSAP